MLLLGGFEPSSRSRFMWIPILGNPVSFCRMALPISMVSRVEIAGLAADVLFCVFVDKMLYENMLLYSRSISAGAGIFNSFKLCLFCLIRPQRLMEKVRHDITRRVSCNSQILKFVSKNIPFVYTLSSDLLNSNIFYQTNRLNDVSNGLVVD